MIIYGYSVKTWKDKSKLYWLNTDKTFFVAFVIWSARLWAM